MVAIEAFLREFLSQPIDVILLKLLIAFGWIPIAFVLLWGFTQMWVNYRQGIYGSKLNWVVLAINVPPASEQSPKALENLFANLQGAKSSLLWKERWIIGKYQSSFSFEIVSTEGHIQFFVRCETRYRDVIEAAIYAHYPEAEIAEVEDYTNAIPDKFPNKEGYELWGSEMVLSGPQYIPFRTYVDFEDRLTQEIKDPLGQILEQLAKMKPGEHFWYQVLIQPLESSDWKDEGLKEVRKMYGIEDKPKESLIMKGLQGALSIPNAMLEEAIGLGVLPGQSATKEEDPFKAFKISPTEKTIAEAIALKASKIGFSTKIRILYIGHKDVYWKQARTALVKGMLQQYTHAYLNKFGLYDPATPKDDYVWQRWGYAKKQETLLAAYKGRSFGAGATPKVLNTEELATLWHFPAIGLKAPLIEKAVSKRGEPPVGLPILPFGTDPNAQLGDERAPELPGIDEGLEALEGPPGLPGASREAPGLPRPTAPTRSAGDSGVQTSSADDDFVPPNLPI